MGLENKQVANKVFFITFLRALAACLITNAHYTGIYPTDLIANGGLIGDVLFFAVSGYCLFNVKYPLSVTGFGRWYGKRLWRVFLPTVLMTAIFVLIGAYSLEEHNALWWFCYPTYYHFVASIIVLYVPFFFIMKINALRKRLVPIMVVIAVAWLFVYWTIYDRSYYHIDTVREPMIRFLFMESMLLGAWFKQNDGKFRNKFKLWYPFVAASLFIVYIVSKLLFSHRENLSNLQFLNQVAIYVLLVMLFMTFAGLDEKLQALPKFIKKIINFIAEITLEIYLVQYVIITWIRPIGHFPLNWFILTGAIIISAFILHKICNLIYVGVDKCLKKVRLEGRNL